MSGKDVRSLHRASNNDPKKAGKELNKMATDSSQWT